MRLRPPHLPELSPEKKAVDNKHFMRIYPDLNMTEGELMEDSIQHNKRSSRQKDITIQQEYLPAKYQRALKYRCDRVYMTKEGLQYRTISVCEDTNKLKYFGLGPYFFIQFMRRICWLFLFFSIVQGIRMHINLRGSGLSKYSLSFSTYLITTSLGNYDRSIISDNDAYFHAIIPCVNLFIFFLFFISWKCHYANEIQDEELNDRNIKPQKYCMEIAAENDQQTQRMNEKSLRTVYEQFGPIYEISLVKYHQNNLQYFEELDDLEQKIKQEDLELRIEYPSKNYNPQSKQLTNLNKQRQALNYQIKKMKLTSSTISAFVHFQYQKSKQHALSHFNHHYQFDKCLHNSCRCCCWCCLDGVQQKYKIDGKHNMLIKRANVPTPQDINWESYQISRCNKFCRYFFTIVVIILFLALTSLIIGVCTIYVSSHSTNCDEVPTFQTIAQVEATNNETIKKCYCNSNLFSSLSDDAIYDYCQSYLKDIYTEQAVQYAIIATEAFTNFLFGFFLDKLINCLRPSSQSESLKRKTTIFTIFLIFNSVFLPILLYAEIFGFKSSRYFSFLSIISTDFEKLLSVDNITFYVDFETIWYRNVSPLFTNFVFIDILITWFSFLITKCRFNGWEELKEKQDKILQKTMNQQMIRYELQVFKEQAYFLLIIFICCFLAGGMPVLAILGFFSLLSRYYCNRNLLMWNSKRISGLGIIFSQIIQDFIPITIILSSLNCCWMLTANPQIYSSALNISLHLWNWNNEYILSRQLYLPQYLILSLLVFLIYILYNTLIKFCTCICNCCHERKLVQSISGVKPFSQYTKSMNILTSYNIKKNDKMKNAVERMEMYSMPKNS